MQKKIPALVITKEAVQNDQALRPGARGARKLLVTTLLAQKEQQASDIKWSPPVGDAKCSVQSMQDTELAVFNHLAKQDRHFHKFGTKIYVVIEGKMVIEVDDQDYQLSAGDLIVVNPGAVHAVKPQTEFLCQVVTVNCRGQKDKFVL